MVKWIKIVGLLCCLSVPLRATAQAGGGTSAAAQDGAGTVWTLPQANNTEGELRCWHGAWKPQTIPGTTGFRPAVLTRGVNGSVYVFWRKYNLGQSEPPQCLISMHRGAGSRIFASFTGVGVRPSYFPNTPMISVGTSGDVWVTGLQPLLWHIEANGSVQSFPLKPEQDFGAMPTGDFYPKAIVSLADGANRRWFWQG